MKLKAYEYIHLKQAISRYEKRAEELKRNDGSTKEWQEAADCFCEAMKCLERNIDRRVNETIFDKIND